MGATQVKEPPLIYPTRSGRSVDILLICERDEREPDAFYTIEKEKETVRGLVKHI